MSALKALQNATVDELHGYDPKTVRRYTNQELLPPPSKRGRRGEYLYTPQDFEQLLEALRARRAGNQWHAKRGLSDGGAS